MISGNSKKGFKDFAVRGISLLSTAALLFSAGCTLGGSNFSAVDKDIKTDYHALISASGNNGNTDNGSDNQINTPDNNNGISNPDGTDTNDNGNGNAEDKAIIPGGFLCVDNCGFEVYNSGSFANRAQGIYKIVSDGRVEEYIEFYNVNDNLYAFYSGNGYGGMEFFTDDYVGFSSQTANSMRVKILSFSGATNNGYYISGGKPAEMDMVFTEDGIEFTDYDTSSGDTLFAPAEVKLERITGEMGYLDGFAYMDDEYSAELLCEDLDIETTDIPDEILGGWILLGDLESGIAFEFTEDGYVQAYLKNYNTEVTFLRGTYTVGREKVNGGTNIYMNIVYFGMGQGYPFNLCYKMDGDNLELVKGNSEYGEDVAWEGAMFIPYEMSNIQRQNFDGSAAISAGSVYGTYVSDDGQMLLLTEGDYFYLYKTVDLEDISDFVEGHFETTPGSLELYELDYVDGNDIYYGFIALMEQDKLSLTIKETGETIDFTRY
ncbi:MAG: hypothetical protein J6X97_04965 [Lachnospiraceae bacterium]|nr:hypothetical protein [Lachnospiraceae bacterium]